ncbi:hypothetical protein SOVF_030680 [Spinacia oleracea]|nr:hypothetical protein SOVF_030680 [Spinacia oleracea]
MIVIRIGCLSWREAMKLCDVDCDLHGPRILSLAPRLICLSFDSGIAHFAVNGVSEDWDLVKQMNDSHLYAVPESCFETVF